MADEGFKRKLTAIFSADAVGYSRLMRDDEAATVRDIAAHRVLITEIIQQHHGRVIDSPGDNILAEFASVVDAVNGAIKIQAEITKSNADTPKDRRMEFRIGINLGDVIEEESRIYGDGVNIAARVEGLASAGGISISGTVYEHIKDKLSLGYHYLGEQNVKNMPEPVRVYRLLTEPEDAGKMIDEEKTKSRRYRYTAFGALVLIILVVGALFIWNNSFRVKIEPASIDKMTFPLPDKPSIAVLPFDNMSGDPKHDYIADGFTENIITGLSQIPEMFVIARNSVFTYKGKAVKVKQVSEELGVKYVLEGSIQKEGDRLRVTAQLIDALKGHHLWAERYDRELKELFKLQDEITLKILSTLHVKLVLGGDDFIWWRTNSFEAWSHNVKGWNYFDKYTKQDNLKAREHHEQALKLDPDYWAAWELLAWTYIADVWLGSSESPKESIKRAFEIAKKTSDRWGKGDLNMFMSQIYYLQGQYEKAIVEGEKAVALAPNSSRFHLALAASLNHGARPEDAIVHAKTAMRLEPYYPARFLDSLGAAYGQSGQYEEALEVYKDLLERALKGEYPIAKAHRRLAGSYARLNRMEEARAHCTESLIIDPNFFVGRWRKKARSFFKNQNWIDSSAEMLLKAGFPEHPPLKLPDKPSIAVLAFKNMSGDPEQEYFSEGLTDELISDLAKISGILVISRNSAFTYKGKQVKISQIAKELNVKYVLEGSVQKSGRKVRIRAQLIDGQTDSHLWAESYDGVMDDIFELQDKITEKIVSALAVKLTSGEQIRTSQKQTNSIPAYNAYLKGMAYLRLYTPDDMVKAIEFFKEAVTLDPNYGKAYTALAEAYGIIGVGGREYWRKAGINYEDACIIQRHYIKLAMNNPVPKTFSTLARYETSLRDWDKVISYAEKAVALAPNDAMVLYDSGRALTWADRPQEAIGYLKKSYELDPLNKTGVFMVCPYFSLKQYKEAATAFEQSSSDVHNDAGIFPYAAASYAYLERKEEAKATINKWIESVGRLSADTIYSVYSLKNPEVFERLMEGIKMAGREGGTKIYVKVDINHKLTGQMIKELMFDRTEVVSAYFTDEFIHRKEDGRAIFQVGDSVEKGLSWIENDKLCNKFEKKFGGYNDCFYVYKNALGDSKYKNDYLKVTDYGIVPFTIRQ